MPALVFVQTTRLRGSEAELDRRGDDGRIAAPIDEGAEDAAVAEMRKGRRHPGDVEGEEFGRRSSRQTPWRTRDARRP